MEQQQQQQQQQQPVLGFTPAAEILGAGLRFEMSGLEAADPVVETEAGAVEVPAEHAVAEQAEMHRSSLPSAAAALADGRQGAVADESAPDPEGQLSEDTLWSAGDDACAAEESAHQPPHPHALAAATQDERRDDDDDDDECCPASSCPSSSPSPLFVPGPLVTERRTVRVFETVTETVRVGVVAQTLTASDVATAAPLTVEETVYETETVRITVSVPVGGGCARRSLSVDG